MTIEEILVQIDKISRNVSRDNLNKHLKTKHIDLYNEIEKRTIELNKFKSEKKGKILDISIYERLYCIKNGLFDRPKCCVCNDKYVNRFIVNENRYSNWCSISCSCKDKNTLSKSKQTRLRKYGDANYNNKNKAKITRFDKNGGKFHTDDFPKKVKQTKLERYGDENYVNVEKNKQTKLERYGDENYVNVEKNKQTKLERYGDENFNNREQFKQTISLFTDNKIQQINDKRIQTNLDKYGVKFATQNDNIKIKSKQTIKNKYGVDSIFNIAHVREKSIISKKQNSFKFLNEHLTDYEILFTEDEYVLNRDVHKLWKFKHTSCGNIYESEYDDGKFSLCPVCYPKYEHTSKDEKEILTFIQSIYKDDIIENDRTIISPYELDIYLPKIKLAIEFDGLYWHSDNEKQNNYHIMKTNMCEKQGIQLIHIFEDEWIYKKEIVKSRIKNLLGLYDNVIYARNCVVKNVDMSDTISFLDDNHLQSSFNSKINFGLYCNDEIVSIMTFGKTRFSNKYEWELLRFCNKKNYHVVGGASKLLKHFERTINPKSLVSYADRRWSIGNLYKKIGFTFSHNTYPNYWYFTTQSYMRESRIKYQKHKLSNLLKKYNENDSEIVNMKSNGYLRIFDCGNMVFVKEYNHL